MINLVLTSWLAAIVMTQTISYNETWWGGSNKTYEMAVWPLQRGVYAETSTPGSRYGGAFFVDTQTNMAFIFGGSSYITESLVDLPNNDVWRLDLSSDNPIEWIWIHGGDVDPALTDIGTLSGVYTTIGDTSSDVFPGARHYFSFFYDPDVRKLFIFGGGGLSNTTSYGILGDHWTYDVDSNMFTWLGGTTTPASPPEYTLLEESEATKIGGVGASAYAYDKQNKLFYIFGGYDLVTRSSILWRYRVSNNQFTALAGGFDPLSTIAPYGEFHPNNVPGGRQASSMVVVNGTKLYVYGGAGEQRLRDSPSQSGYSTLTDMWIFDLHLNQWAIISANAYAYDEGLYSSNSSVAYPASRAYHNLILDVKNNLIFMQGGRGLTVPVQIFDRTDEWIFNLTSQQWTLLSGDGTSLVQPYLGSLRTYSPDNKLGARVGSISFTSDYDAYIFGGEKRGDIWKLPLVESIILSTTTTTSTTTSSSTATTGDVSTVTTAAFTTEIASTTSTQHSTVIVPSSTASTETTVETIAQSSTELTSNSRSSTTTPQSTTDAATIYSTVSIVSSTQIFVTSSTEPLSSTESTTAATAVTSFATIISSQFTSSTSVETIQETTNGLTSTHTSEVGSMSLDPTTISVEFTRDVNSLTSFMTSRTTTKDGSTSTTSGGGAATDKALTQVLSRDGVTSVLKKADAQEQQRNLDPIIVISIACVAGVLLLLIFVIISIVLLRKKKRNMTSYGLSSRPVLPAPSQSFDVTPSISAASTQAATTLFTQNQDVLSIPAYLELSETSFRILSKLSGGGGGDIFLADALDDRTSTYGKTLIVKSVKSDQQGAALTDKQLKLFEQELSIMALFRNHKNFAKLIGFCRSDNFYILMKHYPLGSLDKYLLNRSNPVNKSLVTHFISDIANGIQALHQNHLAHSDIKTANVLIDTDEEGYAFCVLTDFGITQVLSLNMVATGFNVTNIRGLSCSYASPEAFVRQKAQGRLPDKPEIFKSGDVYSLGSIVYESMTRKCPWY